MKLSNHIDGHHFASFHPSWGGFSEELFFYTSRYYGITEAFLRGLIDRRDFSMSGYKAKNLSTLQREVMASVLTNPPNPDTGFAVISIVEKVIGGDKETDDFLLESYPPQPEQKIHPDKLNKLTRRLHKLDISPLDPWLNMAKRLQMPVAIRDHHVEVDIHKLTEHLNSTSQTIRKNLINDIIALHEAGYKLRDHSHLTHAEALEIGDEGAV